MNYFIRKVLSLFIFFALISTAADFFLSSLVRKTNLFQGECEVWSDIYDSNINCDIAVYGSSRSWVQVNPTTIENRTKLKTYNFGVDGHSFHLQHLRHLEFLKHNAPPKIIILCLGPHTLEKKSTFYNMEQLIPFMLWNWTTMTKTIDFEGVNKWDYIIPMVRYSGKTTMIKEAMAILIGKKLKKTRIKGFKSNNKSWTKNAEQFLKSNKSYISKIDENTKMEFEKFIDDCKNNNIDLKLIYTPEFIDGQKKIINKDLIVKLFNRIAINKDIKFYDFSNHKICNEKANFYNTEHLNSKGSSIFTNILIDKVIKNTKINDE